jgi:hypothetical protein
VALVINKGGIEEISFLLQAKHKPTGKLVSMIMTDLTLSTDYEFIDEIIVITVINQTNMHYAKMFKHPRLLPRLVSFVSEETLWSTTIPIQGNDSIQHRHNN